MSEVACSDEIEDSTAQITKWQDDPVQHTVKHAFEFGILVRKYWCLGSFPKSLEYQSVSKVSR
jgi:hypothetical protein